jgi:hypothetical protein
VKEYDSPATTACIGVPLIVGSLYDLTSIENAVSVAFDLPSLTLMRISAYVPVCLLVGVPSSFPVAMLKLAHAGLWAIEKLSASPAGPVASGVNV